MKPIAELIGGRPVHTLPASTTVLAAVREMDVHRVGAILVLDADEHLAGIFTERDLMVRVVVRGLDPSAVSLAEVMTRDLFTAAPTERVGEVAHKLQARHIRHVPVVEDGAVVGILSLRDLLAAHLEVKEREVEHLTAYIQGKGEEAR
jgi:CBS domain-containing protein